MIDLTVAAVPFYFGSMAVEHAVLKRRTAEKGPSAGDYERNDTLASLSMGVGSLVIPVAMRKVLDPVRLDRTRKGRRVMAGAAVLAGVATVADRLSRSERRSERVRRAAQAVAAATGPAAMFTAGATITTTWAQEATATKMFSKRFLPDLGEGPLAWLVAILGWDFIYYWNHRFMHESRYMWAIHVVHHSSQRYNLSTALRQPVADLLGTFAPYGLLSLLGVRPRLVVQARAINLIYQFWIHTETIPKLGPAEEVLNTPSHHRVHHGSNPQYIDRNHGSILITWDRLFGTFEREDEPVVYGLTKNIES
ncbi:MAG TPA: sterol desaturase family protein, partial [Microthrixaceae bacterium]|nr:sterol desaturase family protein [Microthrixaceae bacterium]